MSDQESAILAATPAAAPPAGQTTNFIDPPSQQPAMIAVSTVMIVLTIGFVSLRLYNSIRITRLAGLEDALCVLAVVFSFGYIGVILSLSYVARHMWDVPVIWFTENYWKIRFAGNTLQALAYFTSRLPILMLYLRLFGRQKGFRIACYIAIVAAFCIYLASIPLLSYFCTPNDGGSWGSLDLFAKCKRLLDWAMVQGSCDIALNLYILLLPMTIIVGLQMPAKKKLGVLAIFCTGLLAVLCSALGLYYRYQLSFGPDVNWNEGAFICMSVVEINIAIICSCMPACASFSKHVLQHSSFFTSLRSLFTRSRTSQKQSANEKPSFPGGFSSDSALEQGQHHTPEYVELQNVHDPRWAGGQYSAGTLPYEGEARSGRPHSQAGITKTVAVNIV